MSSQKQFKLFRAYFIIHQIFGISLGIEGIFNDPVNTFVIYMLGGFPVYWIKYNYELYTLSHILKLYYPKLFLDYGFRNPIVNKVRVVMPNILFKKALPVNDELKAKIHLAKWSLIFAGLSFVAVPLMAFWVLH